MGGGPAPPRGLQKYGSQCSPSPTLAPGDRELKLEVAFVIQHAEIPSAGLWCRWMMESAFAACNFREGVSLGGWVWEGGGLAKTMRQRISKPSTLNGSPFSSTT